MEKRKFFTFRKETFLDKISLVYLEIYALKASLESVSITNHQLRAYVNDLENGLEYHNSRFNNPENFDDGKDCLVFRNENIEIVLNDMLNISKSQFHNVSWDHLYNEFI